MAGDTGPKSWFMTLPGLLTAAAAFLTALTGIIAAVSGFFPEFVRQAPATQDCISPFVWRLATSEDHVCVTQETHLRVLQDNELAASRRNPAGGPYGADTCLSGYVFRDAFPGDRVCVEVDTRTQSAVDNQQAQFRIKR